MRKIGNRRLQSVYLYEAFRMNTFEEPNKRVFTDGFIKFGELQRQVFHHLPDGSASVTSYQ
jgi:hypothetical protein